MKSFILIILITGLYAQSDFLNLQPEFGSFEKKQKEKKVETQNKQEHKFNVNIISINDANMNIVKNRYRDYVMVEKLTNLINPLNVEHIKKMATGLECDTVLYQYYRVDNSDRYAIFFLKNPSL
jgi:hypothetical protein